MSGIKMIPYNFFAAQPIIGNLSFSFWNRRSHWRF
jgi:hypothetical protein